MAVGVAVALGIEDGGIGGVDHAIAVLVGDVVIQRIDHLAGVNTISVVPVQMIIDREQIHPGRETVIPPAQQGQILRQQRRLFALEDKLRRWRWSRRSCRTCQNQWWD